MKKKKNRASSSKNKSVKLSNEVTFKAFFSRCVNIGKCKPNEEQLLNIFFKRNGLRDKEDSSTYQKMLEKY